MHPKLELWTKRYTKTALFCEPQFSIIPKWFDFNGCEKSPERSVELRKVSFDWIQLEHVYLFCSLPVNWVLKYLAHCLDLNLNGKRPGVASDGNFSSYLTRWSGYGWLFLFPVGGNGNNQIYPLLSTVLSTWTELETCFG